MKKYLVFGLFFMVFLVLAKTETVEMKEGESFEIKDKNVTLIKFDPENDKIIVCVNNEKAIVSDELDKSVNGVTIHIKSVKIDYAKIELTRSCTSSKCSCEETSEDCSNVECFNECDYDSECDDGDEDTLDFCTGSPKKCVNNPIEKQVECVKDAECDDANDCTIDKCVDGECIHDDIIGCVLDEEVDKPVEVVSGDKNGEYFIVFSIILSLIIVILLFIVFRKK